MTQKHLIVPSICLALTVLAGTVKSTAYQTAAPRSANPNEMPDRADALDSRLKAVEEKTDRSELEKDYIERIQKQYEAYYEKVLNTQMWTLGIMGFILTAVFGLTAKFGFEIFDRRIDHRLNNASTQLRTEFVQKLGEELQQLKVSNAIQVSELEAGLMKRIRELQGTLEIRSEFQSRFARGFTSIASGHFEFGSLHFRSALRFY